MIVCGSRHEKVWRVKKAFINLLQAGLDSHIQLWADKPGRKKRSD